MRIVLSSLGYTYFVSAQGVVGRVILLLLLLSLLLIIIIIIIFFFYHTRANKLGSLTCRIHDGGGWG